LFVCFLDDKILEQIASGDSSDDVTLVRKFISASKDRTVKPESITVDFAVKGKSHACCGSVIKSSFLKSNCKSFESECQREHLKKSPQF